MTKEEQERYNEAVQIASEGAFVEHKIYDCLFRNEDMRPVNKEEAWERITDVDYYSIANINGKSKIIFHEVKGQPQQFIDNANYFNLCIELISNTRNYQCDDCMASTKGQKDCNTCNQHNTCNHWGTWHKDSNDKIKWDINQTAKSPVDLKQCLQIRGEDEKYRDEYFIKFGVGWLYKNQYVEADYYHFWLPFIFENNESKAVVHEDPTNISKWMSNTILTDESKMITRIPFDFFVSMSRDMLLQFIKGMKEKGMGQGLGYYLPVKTVNDYYRKERPHGLAITPLIEYIDRHGNTHTEKINGVYTMSASLAKKAGISTSDASMRWRTDFSDYKYEDNEDEEGYADDQVREEDSKEKKGKRRNDKRKMFNVPVTTISRRSCFYNSRRNMNESPTQLFVELFLLGKIEIEQDEYLEGI